MKPREDDELRARLTEAERERDEANERHAALAEHVVACLPYEAETDGEALDAWECVDAASREIARLSRERDEARAALAEIHTTVCGGNLETPLRAAQRLALDMKAANERLATEPARIAAAVEARDVAWTRAACSAAPGPRSFMRAGLGTTRTDDVIEAVCSGATDADIAAAIRAARGAR